MAKSLNLQNLQIQQTLGKFAVVGLTSGVDTIIAADEECKTFNAFVCNEALTITCTQEGSATTDDFVVTAAMIGLPVYGSFTKLEVPIMSANNGFLAYKSGVI